MSWSLVKLGKLCTVVRGSSPRPQGDPRYYGGHVPRLMVSDVTRDGKYVTPKIDYLTDAGAKLSRPMKKGDFVIAVSGQPGQPLILAVDACIHDGFAGLRNLDEERIHKDYLFHFMMNAKAKFSATAVGAIFKNLTTDQIKELELPLPPLKEQKRIAAILDKADAIRRKRQQAIKLADDFLRSVFLEMFGDPVTNPKGWEVRMLGEVVDSQLGKMLSAKSKVGDFPKKYLRNANVRWREFDLEDMSVMDFDEREMKKFNLREGDLLVCEGGEIGRCAIWREQLKDCFFQKALHRVRVSPEFLTSEYVQEYFYWMSTKGGLVKSSSEVTFSHLTAEKLKTLNVPLPPILLQKKFSNIYKKYDDLKMKIQRTSCSDENMFSSLSQKAFSGKLQG